MFSLAIATSLAVIIPCIIVIFTGKFAMHWSVCVIQWMLLFLVVSGGRFSMRVIRSLASTPRGNGRRRVVIYGAGDAGEMLCRDLQNNRHIRYTCIGFIDDDVKKHHKVIHNVPILGGLEQVEDIVNKRDLDEIIVAMPSMPGNEVRALLDKVKTKVNSKVTLKTVPGLTEMVDGIVTFNQVRQFRVRDLLRRKSVELDTTAVDKLLRGKTVLVSGAGGSIGSEICRQVCTFSPKRLIMYDISEASLYIIQEELSNRYGDVPLATIVSDICIKERVEMVFNEFEPDIVFHAAAYKHVPLMEYNPWSAIHNNVISSKNLAEVSAKHDIERFVMISTDKAVRPSSIMGASKRLCEMIVQMQLRGGNSIFSCVRFGNVMGSSGSVIPKFDAQIKAGGPVTITDRNATRYFMLTSEAVQLVMQSATLEKDDAIYLLDMGQPVKIVDLATDMIRLLGLEPNIDIKLKYVGLRPGEKIHEELYASGKGEPTPIDKISVAVEPIPNHEHFLENIDSLIEKCFSLSREELINAVYEIVPDYHREDRRKPKNDPNQISGTKK